MTSLSNKISEIMFTIHTPREKWCMYLKFPNNIVHQLYICLSGKSGIWQKTQNCSRQDYSLILESFLKVLQSSELLHVTFVALFWNFFTGLHQIFSTNKIHKKSIHFPNSILINISTLMSIRDNLSWTIMSFRLSTMF